MALPRPFALVQTEDQWLRCAHENTALLGSVVELAFEDAPSAAVGPQLIPPPAGLAFDSHCRIYHSVPEEGRVERQLWAGGEPLDPATPRPNPVDLFAPLSPSDLGDFQPIRPRTAPLTDPRTLTIDSDDRLYVGETAARRLLVFDLWAERLLRRVMLPGEPIDFAVDEVGALVLLRSPSALLHLNARTGPSSRTLPAGSTNPCRIAISPEGKLFVLENAGASDSRILANGYASQEIPFASDLEFLPQQTDDNGGSFAVLIVARRPGEDFVRLRIGSTIEELPPLKARGYDGRGIVRTPDRRIGFWTAQGFRHAVPARVRYRPQGRVTTFLLDSGQFRTRWGRLFVDACIPERTSILVECVATDDLPSDPPIPRTPPANVTFAPVPRPDLSPPMPSASLVPSTATKTVYRRDTGRELPWARFADDDPFETYEAEILAEPGRYLWVCIELHGDTRFTPRLRSLRTEYPSHDLLRRLPKTFSRDTEAASFLRRYLAIFDGAIAEWDAKSTTRQALIDPLGAPPEVLPWLAGFVGMVLDERWPLATQRTAIREAIWLFRFRGTVPGLKRFLEIYLNTQVIIVEKFRLRGLGAVGDSGGPVSRAILGAGFRVGGAVGDDTFNPLSDTAEDAFDTHAHRFSVMIPAYLSSEQLDVVQQILEVHRPAHTVVDVCTAGSGMRVGRGLMVEMTSIIGRTGGFRQLQIGGATLGRDGIVGTPLAGTTPGASVLGRDSRVG